MKNIINHSHKQDVNEDDLKREPPYGWQMRTLLSEKLPEELKEQKKEEGKCEHEWSERNYCLYNSLHERCSKCGCVR